MFGDDFDFRPLFSLGIHPAILFQPPHYPHAPAFLQILGAGRAQAGPGLDVEIRHFLFESLFAVFIEAIGGEREIADLAA